MSTIKLIGRTTDFKGKTLWEILANLRNHGVGRIVQRNMFQRYPEPSYMRIVKVDALPNPTEGDRKVKVTVEKTFRGRTSPKLIDIYSTSYKADYLLVPKDQEAALTQFQAPDVERILPQTMEFPPLLREFIVRETNQSNPRLQVKIKQNREKLARIAADGETPNVTLSMGLGKPVCEKLYKGINLTGQ